jgi:hypothetical protein
MGRFAFVAWSIAVTAALTVHASGASMALCEGVASRIRADSALSSGAAVHDPLARLSEGESPYIEVAKHPIIAAYSRNEADHSSFIDRFRAQFRPSDALGAAVDQFASLQQNEVFSLPLSNLHLIVNTAGSMSCRSFLFFEGRAGEASRPVSAQPKVSDPVCYNASGHLARIDGTVAYLELARGLTGFGYDLRVVPWQSGKWADGCSVTAGFRSHYETARAFVRPGGPIRGGAIRGLAARLVEAFDRSAAPESFHFGPAWPPYLDDTVRELKRLGAALGTAPVPTFGAPTATLGPFYRELQDPDTFPLVVDGHAYLVQIGHATIGWRVFHDSIVIVYAMRDGRLSPVASAIVEQHQGELESVKVSTERR